MILVNRVRHSVAILSTAAFVTLSFPAMAQEISDSHLKAARAAIASIRATDPFDRILPAQATALKQTLIEKNPDLQELITTTVDNKTVELAARRADLEREAALAYAKVFPEADLTAIAEFYSGEAGKRLLSEGPLVTRELDKAADIWQRGIARDLAEEVGKSIATALPPAPAPAPAGTEEPAPAEPAPAE